MQSLRTEQERLIDQQTTLTAQRDRLISQEKEQRRLRRAQIRSTAAGIGLDIGIGLAIGAVTTIIGRIVDYSDAIEKATNSTRQFELQLAAVGNERQFESTIQQRIRSLEELNRQYSRTLSVRQDQDTPDLNFGERFFDFINVFSRFSNSRTFAATQRNIIESELESLRIQEQRVEEIGREAAIREEISRLERETQNISFNRSNLQEEIRFLELLGGRDEFFALDAESIELQALNDVLLQLDQRGEDVDQRLERLRATLQKIEEQAAETADQISNAFKAVVAEDRLNIFQNFIPNATDFESIERFTQEALQANDALLSAQEAAIEGEPTRTELFRIQVEHRKNIREIFDAGASAIENLNQQEEQRLRTIVDLQRASNQVINDIADAHADSLRIEVDRLEGVLDGLSAQIRAEAQVLETLEERVNRNLDAVRSQNRFADVFREGRSIEDIEGDLQRRFENLQGVINQQQFEGSPEEQASQRRIASQALEREFRQASNRETTIFRETELERRNISRQTSLDRINNEIRTALSIQTANAKLAEGLRVIEEERQDRRESVFETPGLSEAEFNLRLERINSQAESAAERLTNLAEQRAQRIRDALFDVFSDQNTISFKPFFDQLEEDAKTAAQQIEREVDIIFSPLQRGVSDLFSISFDYLEAQLNENRQLEEIQVNHQRRISDIRNDENLSFFEQQERIREAASETARQREDLARRTEQTISQTFGNITIAFARSLQQQLIAFAAAEAQKRLIGSIGSTFLGTGAIATIGGPLLGAGIISAITALIAGSFHDPVNDELARRAGISEGLRQIARGDGSFGRQSANDQVSNFRKGFSDAMSKQQSQQLVGEVSVNIDGVGLVKAIAPILIKEQNIGTIPKI